VCRHHRMPVRMLGVGIQGLRGRKAVSIPAIPRVEDVLTVRGDPVVGLSHVRRATGWCSEL
jgi:hypothetical protein